jgi:hypothetical protein
MAGKLNSGAGMASCCVVASLWAPTEIAAQSKKALSAFTGWAESLSIWGPLAAKRTVYSIEHRVLCKSLCVFTRLSDRYERLQHCLNFSRGNFCEAFLLSVLTPWRLREGAKPLLVCSLILLNGACELKHPFWSCYSDNGNLFTTASVLG